MCPPFSANCRRYCSDTPFCKLAAANPTPDPPPGGGANFVDVTLKVVVQQAQGTMLAFQSDHIHGTTVSYGTVNHIIAITFSKSIAVLYRQKMDGKNGIFSKAY